ncbi:MAG: hypothetical protein JJ975_02345 [Bacteroidia bacterium]|nr:hypothetical protein [Bacteroidia bacterium]
MRLLLTACLLSFLLVTSGCSQPTPRTTEHTKEFGESVQNMDTAVPLAEYFTRDSITHLLEWKSNNDSVRVIHVLVPLCDNEHQGIVPVNSSLGDGMNLRTNLYWGAGYGIKTHFTRSNDWQSIDHRSALSDNVLERVVFSHKSKNVILVADAYRGDRMVACLTDFFETLAGNRPDTLLLDSMTLDLNTCTDLVVFNGHNGLMDEGVNVPENQDGRAKDAVVIACASQPYFNNALNKSGGYPLVLTSHFLAPEAYVLHNILRAWIDNKPAETIRFSAAEGYHSIQKCGIRGASNLFVSGWKN